MKRKARREERAEYPPPKKILKKEKRQAIAMLVTGGGINALAFLQQSEVLKISLHGLGTLLVFLAAARFIELKRAGN
jgi:hypothetical protein